MQNDSANRAVELRALAGLFLKLGLTAFGGPAAHIALMEEEVVRRRQWLRAEEFLDLLGATNLIPGPNSTEMAIYIGYRRAGWAGLFVAGLCFIVPAALLVTACGWFYVRFGALPEVAGLLYGIKPVLIAVVIQALWGLGRTALKRPWLGWVAAAVVGALIAGVHELILLGVAGTVSAVATSARRGGGTIGARCLSGPGFTWDPLLAGVAPTAGASSAALFLFRVNASWLVLAGAAVGAVKGLLG